MSAKGVNGLRAQHDPKSHAFCEAHISLTVPLPRELTDTDWRELETLAAGFDPFAIACGPLTHYLPHPGVCLPIAPQAAVDRLRIAAEGARAFADAPRRSHPFSAHMTIAEFITAVSADGERLLGTLRPDHEGRFVLPAPARREPVRLFATTDRRLTLEHAETVTWADIQGQSVAFAEPTVRTELHVRCVDDTGVGVETKLRVTRRFGDDWMTVVESDSAADGTFNYALRGVGEHRVRMQSATTRSTQFRLGATPERVIDATGQEPVHVEFMVPRPAAIIVWVIDESGAPLPGAIVGLSTQEPLGLLPHPQGRTTDFRGRALISGIEPGEVLLRASMVDRMPVARRRTVTTGLNEETFALAPGGLEVRMQLTGLPDDFPSPEDVGLHLIRVAEVTDEMAVFRLDRLDEAWRVPPFRVPSGQYQLTIRPRGKPQTVLWFAVASRDVDVGKIDMTGVFGLGELTMDVLVDTDDGTRGYGPSVLYRNEAWPSNLWRQQGVWLGNKTRVKGLTAGTYRLRPTPQAFDPDTWDLSEMTRVHVEPGVAPPTATLTIRRR